MRGRIHIDELRSTDPKTLEIVIQDALRKPIRQLTPETLADLVALSEVDALPKNLRRDLGVFAGRVGQEIADLPDGPVIKEFLGGLDELDAPRVPETIRDYIQRESEREARAEADRELATGLLEKWKEVEPDSVALPSTEPRIQRGEAVSEDAPKARSRSRSSGSAKKAAPIDDIDRTRWISSACLERLTPYREAGLAEPVLVAGIRKEAEDAYPDLMPWEITKVLRTLQDNGQVRRSAGRWARVGRFW